MNESYDTQTVNPSIEKYVSASNNGIETHKFTRCVIGYILHGEKYVYYDDKCYKFSQGDLFFLGMGCHYTKNIPAQGHPYEQILVRYTSEELDDGMTAKQMYRDIKEKMTDGERYYLLLDEVQEIDGWEKAVNSLLENANTDIYVTGSNSHMMSSETVSYTHLTLPTSDLV